MADEYADLIPPPPPPDPPPPPKHRKLEGAWVLKQQEYKLLHVYYVRLIETCFCTV